MIKRIKELVEGKTREEPVELTAELLEELAAALPPKEPDMRTIGIFTEVAEEKCAELVHAMLYLDELNGLDHTGKNQHPIQFYISTYGGSADDMFGLYDVMRQIKKENRDSHHWCGQGNVGGCFATSGRNQRYT